MRLVAMSKSEGIVGGGEGLHPTAYCAWMVLVGLKSCSPLLSMKYGDCLPSAWVLLPVFHCPWPEILFSTTFCA